MTTERRALVDALKASRPDSCEELAACQALDKYDREHPLPRWRARAALEKMAGEHCTPEEFLEGQAVVRRVNSSEFPKGS